MDKFLDILAVVIVVVWLIAMWGVFFYAVKRGWGPLLKNKMAAKVRVSAVVKHKQEYGDYDAFENNIQIARKEIVFECEDGMHREYSVPDRIYDWVELGDDGTLIYQGDNFVDFEARRPRTNPDELLGKMTR
ncbi:MAG: DUF2500 domain-containing protein [Armatimonadota bacterium]